MTNEKVKNGIVKRGSKWAYVLRVPDQLTGKTKPQWISGFDSAQSAKVARDKARVLVANRDYVSPTKITVGEYLVTWINRVHAGQIKASTLARYKQIINNYLIPGLGSIKLQDLRPSQVQSLYTKMLTTPGISGKPLTGRTVQFTGAVLRIAIKYAVEVDGLLTVNPVSKVPLPKNSPTIPTPLTLSELNLFLEVASAHRLYFFYRLSAYTGARRGELLALRWSDFDGKAITINKTRSIVDNEAVEINSTKGGNNGQRRVPLDTQTIEQFSAHRKRQIAERLALGEFWQETGYVFIQENGVPLYPGTPSDLFKKLAKSAGLRVTRLHDIRHLHATELLRLGEPLHIVAHRLGHRDAMVTATIYAHITNEQADTASERFANATQGVSKLLAN